VTALLEVSELAVDIDGHRVLHDVSFTVRRGEMIALLGPSGSGKSTLLRAICRQVIPSSGSIRGTTGAGFVPQLPYEARSPLSIREIVTLGHPRKGLRTRSAERHRAELLLDRLGLADLGNRRLAELSGGQRQRVAIATALGLGSPVLLLDEPTSGADPVLAEDVLALLRELADFDNAVLVAGHDASRLVTHVDRVLGLNNGRLVADVPAAGIDDRVLADVYRPPVRSR
jgi:ABC-type Mn2+/Zn2+ transport system ATPase subunit